MDNFQVDKTDLLYLLTMTYGYIDDELGGMESENDHVKIFKYIIEKYKIDMNEVKMGIE